MFVFYHLCYNPPILAASSSINICTILTAYYFVSLVNFLKYFMYVSVNKLCSQVDCLNALSESFVGVSDSLVHCSG